MESDFTCNPGPTQILFRLKNLTWPEHAAVPAVADQQLAAPHHRRLTLPKSGSIFVAAFSTDFSSDASCDAWRYRRLRRSCRHAVVSSPTKATQTRKHLTTTSAEAFAQWDSEVSDWWEWRCRRSAISGTVSVCPDLAIYCSLGNFYKPVGPIILPTFLGNFCWDVKIFHFSCGIIFGQLF